MQSDFQSLIEYRIEQSYKTSKEIEILIEKELFALAINRIYYAMFYMLLALSLKYEFKTSKHKQLLGWFNKEFVKTGQIDRTFGRIIHKAHEDRNDGDYGIFIEFKKIEVERKYQDMKMFISEVEKLIRIN